MYIYMCMYLCILHTCICIFIYEYIACIYLSLYIHMYVCAYRCIFAPWLVHLYNVYIKPELTNWSLHLRRFVCKSNWFIYIQRFVFILPCSPNYNGFCEFPLWRINVSLFLELGVWTRLNALTRLNLHNCKLTLCTSIKQMLYVYSFVCMYEWA